MTTQPTTPTDDRLPGSLAEALLWLQRDPPVVPKSRSGQVGNQKTKYADLTVVNSTVLTRLNLYGVTWSCSPTMVGAVFVLRWELLHVPTGEAKTGDYPIANGPPQAMGSAITYARRYALLSVTGIAAEDDDDDAHAASEVRREEQRRRVVSRAAPAGETVQRRPMATRPATPPLPGEPQPDLINAAQRIKLQAGFGEITSDRGERLRMAALLVNRATLTSANELTREEASRLIDLLERTKTLKEPAERVAAMSRLAGVTPAEPERGGQDG